MTVNPSTDIGKDSYNKYYQFPQFAYACISQLLSNELIWKLLYYNSNDAWNLSNLSIDEKRALIYNGQEDTSSFKVFMDVGIPDVVDQQVCRIHVAPIAAVGKNRSVGIVAMCFECYSHWKINTLSNYTTRVDSIIQIFLETFNGAEIGGMGKMFFNTMRDMGDKLGELGKIPFKGKRIYLSTNV